MSPYLRAILQALFVTFLWSTSWIIIKFGLRDIPALTFAGLRYTFAFLCLLPFALRPASFKVLRTLPGEMQWQLALLGVLFYTVTQGAQFLGLAYLPAVTTSLLLNLTTVVVALLGIGWLKEWPTRLQWMGIALNLAGVILYFYPIALPLSEWLGLGIVLVGMMANALASVLGRQVNRAGSLGPLQVTTVSMGIGALALLALGVITQGLPRLSLTSWLFIVWLAVVNTALAFTLWNHTLRTLSAMQSQMINSTMLIQIALLAWIFLDERLTWREGVGLTLAALGVALVQMRRVQSL